MKHAYFFAYMTTAVSLEIQSDAAQFNDIIGTATYKGHVVLEDEGRRLNANQLVIARDKMGKIKSMIATGDPARFFCSSDKKPLQGEAKTIQYFPNEARVVFLKEAILEQNSDIIKGEHLTYSLTHHTLISTPEEGKQMTLILHSKLTGH
jgi:lipopolysaccharide transport protein LptA